MKFHPLFGHVALKSLKFYDGTEYAFYEHAMRFKTLLIVFLVGLSLAGCKAGIEGFGESGSFPINPPSGFADLGSTTVKADPGNGRVLVSWNELAGAEGYRLYSTSAISLDSLDGVDFSGITSAEDLCTRLATIGVTCSALDVAGMNFTHEGLTNGQAYCYIVAGMKGGSEGPPSVNGECTIPLSLVDLTAAAASGAISVSFKSIPGAESYNIYYYDGAPGSEPPSFSLSKGTGEAKAVSAETGWISLVSVPDTGEETIHYTDTTVESLCRDRTYLAVGINRYGEEMVESGQKSTAGLSNMGVLQGAGAGVPEPTFRRMVDENGFHDGVLLSDGRIALALYNGVSWFEPSIGTFADYILTADGNYFDYLDVQDPLSGDGIYMNALTADASDNVVITGYIIENSQNTQMVMCKFKSTRALDTSFGTDGCYVHPVGDNTSGNDIAVDASGKLYVVGSRVYQFSSNGQAPQCTFSTLAGTAFDHEITGFLGFNKIVVQGTRSIVVGSASYTNGDTLWFHPIVLEFSPSCDGATLKVTQAVEYGGFGQGLDAAFLDDGGLFVSTKLSAMVLEYSSTLTGDPLNAYQTVTDYPGLNMDYPMPMNIDKDCRGRPVMSGVIRYHEPTYGWANNAALWRIDKNITGIDADFPFFMQTDPDPLPDPTLPSYDLARYFWDEVAAIVEDEKGALYAVGTMGFYDEAGNLQDPQWPFHIIMRAVIWKFE